MPFGARWLAGLLRRVVTLGRARLFANAGYLLGVEVVNALVGLLFWSLAARLYRPDEVGTASAVLSAVALITLIGGLGTGNALVRYLSAARDPGLFLNTTLLLNVTAASVVGLAYLAGLRWWSPALLSLGWGPWAAAGLLLYAVAQTVTGGARMALLATRAGRPILIGAALTNLVRVVLVGLLARWGALGLIVANGSGVAVALVVVLGTLLPQALPGYHCRLHYEPAYLRTILPYSFATYLAGLLSQLPQRILPLLVLELLGPTAAGYAQMAWLVGGLLITPGVTLAGSAFAEASHRPDRTTPILLRAGLVGLGVTGLLAAGIWLAAPFLLLIFGPGYAAEGTALLRWLTVAAPLTVAAALYGTALRVRMRLGRLLVLGAVVAVITICTAAAFLPRWGLLACGLGWLAAQGVVALVALEDAAGALDARACRSLARQAGDLIRRGLVP
jgi:O-antigen/teichoic acid export membrane protein